ncbi:hypothetical protein GCM10027416_14010 [Okibacterium endophyticum]
MGKHLETTETLQPKTTGRGVFIRPRSRSPIALFCFAFAAAVSFLAVNVVDPYSGATASPYFQVAPRYAGLETQDLTVAGSYETAFTREGYEIFVPPPPEPSPPPVTETEESDDSDSESSSGGGWAPPAVAPDPGSAQAVAYEMVAARGWGEDQYSCLVSLWNKESGWRVNAHNASSGAYGIPQALPGSKMATAGADWETNPATQITWGLGYIQGRYGSPCGAWAHSQSVGWY